MNRREEYWDEDSAMEHYFDRKHRFVKGDRVSIGNSIVETLTGEGTIEAADQEEDMYYVVPDIGLKPGLWYRGGALELIREEIHEQESQRREKTNGTKHNI